MVGDFHVDFVVVRRDADEADRFILGLNNPLIWNLLCFFEFEKVVTWVGWASQKRTRMSVLDQ